MARARLTPDGGKRMAPRSSLVAVVSMLLLFCVGIIIYNVDRVNRGMHRRLNTALRMAELTLPPAMWQFNYDYLNNFIGSLFLDERMIYARILADGETVVTRTRPPFQGRVFPFFSASTRFETGVADIVYGGRPIGSIQLALSREGIYRELILNTAGALVLMASILLIIGFYYVRLKESEKKYRSLYDNAVEGIFQMTPAGRITSGNPSMARLLGFDTAGEMVAEVSRMGGRLFVKAEDWERMIGLLEEKGRVAGFESRIRRRDGRVIWASFSLQAVGGPNRSVQWYEGVLTDITERKEKEAAETAREAAEASARAKSEFLANMSHEIRTPMNAIMGLTDLALKTRLDERQRDYLGKIWSSARMLLGIINDILDFSKIEAGKMTLEAVAFDLREVVDNLSDMFAGKAAERRIELILAVHPDLPNQLVGDPLRLGQVLINLTSNAIKFTERGEVVVRVDPEGAEPGAVTLRFTVQDTGIGIDETHLPNLFISFSQADGSTTRKYGGTGLGLAISKRLVEMMDGTIRAQSVPGRGSTFIFTARFGLSESLREPSPTALRTFSGMRVLLVDGHETSRMILAQALAGLSLRVEVSDHGPAAVSRLEEANPPFDLAVMDWRVPGVDTLQDLRTIRSRPACADIPVVLVTTFRREEEMVQAREAGATAFLIKPVKQSALFDTLMELFGGTGNGGNVSPVRVRLPVPPKANGLRGARILVVEDNRINQQVATEILQGAGLKVDIAGNGQEAIAAVVGRLQAEGGRYDAVLMDIQMPVMDGFTATGEIRKADPGLGELPIIAMTAHAMRGDRERCMAAGMNDYITKPIDTEQLFATLARWIPDGRASREPAGDISDGRRPPSPPEVHRPGVDSASALKRLRGNGRLLDRLIRGFCEDFRTAADEVEQALDQGDTDTARRVVHTVKGVAGNLSAFTAMEAALDLETAVRDGETERWPGCLARFRAAMEEVAGCASAPSNGGDSGGPASPETASPPTLGELEGLIRKNSPRAQDYFNALRHQLDARGFVAETDTLAETLARFDFKGARKVVADLSRLMNGG